MKFLKKCHHNMNLTILLLRFFMVADTWKTLKKCDVLLLAHDNNRAFNIEGKSYSPLSDTVRFYLERRGIRCEGISKLFDKNDFTHNYHGDKTINRLFLLNFLLAKIIALMSRKDFSEIKFKRKVKAWTKILKHTQPKTVIGIQPDDALCMACHGLQIAVYDLQHGVISENELYYNQDFNKTRDRNCLPTGYLCWDKDSTARLDQWCILRNIKAITLGNPWLYRFQKNDPLDFLVKTAIGENPFGLNKKCILVTLQWGLDKFYPDFFNEDDILHPALLDAISQLGNDVNWLLRLHPIQLKTPKILQSIQQIFMNNPNVEINWSSYQPLPVIFSVTHGHVTWNSACVIEAALFGIKSYVLNPSGFSISTNSGENQPASQALFELPFARQESEGLLERAQDTPSAQDLITWVNQIEPQIKRNTAGLLFDEDRLYEIATGQTG